MSDNRKLWEIAEEKAAEARRDIGQHADNKYADYFDFSPEDIVLDGHFTVEGLQVIINKWKEYKQEIDKAEG